MKEFTIIFIDGRDPNRVLLGRSGTRADTKQEAKDRFIDSYSGPSGLAEGIKSIKIFNSDDTDGIKEYEDKLKDKIKKLNYHDTLQSLKEQLFDAPSEVKSAFNQVVKYFDTGFWLEYIDNGELKYYRINASTEQEARKIVDEWRRDYPDWTDYSKAKIVNEIKNCYLLKCIDSRNNKVWYRVLGYDNIKGWVQQKKQGHVSDIKKGFKFRFEINFNRHDAEIIDGPDSSESLEKKKDELNSRLEGVTFTKKGSPIWE